MFGRISAVARRRLFAVKDTKTLMTLLRYILRLVPFSALTSLVFFCILYSAAEYKFTNWYFALGSVWKPAFPLSWRILFLSLFVVPIFSFLQLLWLALRHWMSAQHWWRRRYSFHSRPSQGYSMLPRSESNSLEVRGLSRDDQDSPSEDIEADGGSPRLFSSFQHHQAFRHRLPFVLTLRFILWFSVLCASLWVGLHYQQPGDVRYLPLIEKANAHFKRAGYGNQGK